MGKQVGQIQVSGKFGALVGAKGRNGRVYLRAKSDKAPKAPTTAQMVVQARFKTIGQLATGAKQAIKMGLKNKAKQLKCSIYNAFVKLNWAAVTANNLGQTTITWGNIVISDGKLPNATFSTPLFEAPLQVDVDITGNASYAGADASDEVYVFLFNEDSNEGLLSSPVARTATTMSIPVPAPWNGCKVRAYGFTSAGVNNTEMKGEVSPSIYFGTGNIA